MKALRHEYKVMPIMKDQVFVKQYDLKHARNYAYKHGEVERIARARFERALKTGDLHEFPNVAFFYKKYVLDRDMAVKEIKDKKDELRDFELQIKELNDDSSVINQPRKDFNKKDKPKSYSIIELKRLKNRAEMMIEERQKVIEDRSRKVKIIEQFLKENTRQSGHVKDETQRPVSIENIEALETKKAYHEWLEHQNHPTDKELKQRLLQKHTMLTKQQKQADILLDEQDDD